MMKAKMKQDVIPGLSLCMIVKNEERYLEGCLDSAKDLVNEIIIVDTGSTDKTIEIAKKFTSKIYHFDWCNDFSKARNESIKYAAYEWIIYLDADERLLKEQFPKIKSLMTNTQYGAYMLNLRCYSDPEDYSQYEMAVYRRMFKNFEGIYFTGKVHEQIYYALNERGVLTGNTEVIIEHLGYAVEKEIMDAKKERNLELLKANLKEHPDDSYTWHQLSGTYISMNRFEDAYMPVMKALSLPDITPTIKARCYNILAMISARYNELYRCIYYTRESVKIAPNQLHAYYYMGDSFYALGLYEGAIEKYKKLYENNEVPETKRKQMLTTDISLKRWQIYQLYIRCYDQLNDFDKVIEYSEKTLKENPSFLEANYQLSVTYTKLKKYAESQKHAKFLNTTELKPKYLLAMGFLEKERKNYTEAIHFFDEFTSIYPNSKEFAQAFLAKSEIYHTMDDVQNTKKATDEFVKLNPIEKQMAIREKLYLKYNLANQVIAH